MHFLRVLKDEQLDDQEVVEKAQCELMDFVERVRKADFFPSVQTIGVGSHLVLAVTVQRPSMRYQGVFEPVPREDLLAAFEPFSKGGSKGGEKLIDPSLN